MPTIKKIIFHFWSLRREFVKYFAIGISALALDVGSLYFLKNFFYVAPFLAIVISQPLILAYVFFLNKSWSFKAKGITHEQMIRFVLLSGANYIIAAVWMWGFNENLKINYLLARLANVALAVAWNFLLYKYWVFREKQAAIISAK